MPRKAAQPAAADENAAPGGAASVDRALSLLTAFRTGESALTLAELAERTRLYKSTALRLLASLEHARLLQRGEDVPGLTGISAPVWGPDGRLEGALTLTLPETRLKASFAHAVRQAARHLSERLGAPAAAH